MSRVRQFAVLRLNAKRQASQVTLSVKAQPSSRGGLPKGVGGRTCRKVSLAGANTKGKKDNCQVFMMT